MYATIREWKGKEERMDETTRKIQEELVPEFRQIDGFLGYWFVDAGGGTVMTVSLFEDAAGSRRSTEVARGFAERELGDVVEGPPRIVEGDVKVHALSERIAQVGGMQAGTR